MADSALSVRKTIVQIGFRGGERFYILGVYGEYDALVDATVYLRQLVAFILVDNEKVTGCDTVKTVVYQKLSAAGNGIVQFIAVMDMHVHGFFFFVEMCDGESMCGKAVFNRLSAGGQFFHNASFPNPF